MRSVLLISSMLALGACTNSSAGADPSADGEVQAAVATGDSPIVEVASAEALIKDLDGLDAETVVVNIWATWCMPCVAEFPHFVEYDREMDGNGVEVRFVSVDAPTDLPAVRQFLDEQDVTEASFLYTGQTDLVSQFNPLYGGSVPVTLILDRERVVKHVNLGTMSRERLAEAVSAVQAGRSPADSEEIGT